MREGKSITHKSKRHFVTTCEFLMYCRADNDSQASNDRELLQLGKSLENSLCCVIIDKLLWYVSNKVDCANV